MVFLLVLPISLPECESYGLGWVVDGYRGKITLTGKDGHLYGKKCDKEEKGEKVSAWISV